MTTASSSEKSHVTTVMLRMAMMALMTLATLSGRAQEEGGMVVMEHGKTTVTQKGGADRDGIHADKTAGKGMLLSADTIRITKQKRDWQTWKPNSKRALWLALVIPGGGQIYNRKYWKLPIIYGGFVGCTYAMRWNNQMYNDYSQAYLDLMDDDPGTHSYDEFLHLGNKITADNMERYKRLFKQRKDRFRRWRDLSFFCLVGVYALSVVDAYVDASLSEFDISKDLSLKVAPAVINNEKERNPLKSNSLGLQCSLNF